jgi:hypothetical protein
MRKSLISKNGGRQLEDDRWLLLQWVTLHGPLTLALCHRHGDRTRGPCTHGKSQQAIILRAGKRVGTSVRLGHPKGEGEGAAKR